MPVNMAGSTSATGFAVHAPCRPFDSTPAPPPPTHPPPLVVFVPYIVTLCVGCFRADLKHEALTCIAVGRHPNQGTNHDRGPDSSCGSADRECGGVGVGGAGVQTALLLRERLIPACFGGRILSRVRRPSWSWWLQQDKVP